MSALSNQPSNPNALHQLGGRMILKRAPHLMFFLQEVNIPGMRLGTVAQPSPHDEMPWAGDRLYRESLSVTFKVDENLKN